MDEHCEERLRHGQSLAMQWVSFSLQKIIADIESGGVKTNQLLDSTKDISAKSPLETIRTGSKYVLNFIIPLSIELALKAFLAKEGKEPDRTHDLFNLYNKLSKPTKRRIEHDFSTQKINPDSSFKDLLIKHRSDFEDWRYLDNPEAIQTDDKELQIALCSILSIYNS